MSRKLMLLGPLFAFVLPLALSQPSAARPLATPAQPAEWCWGDCDDEDKDEDGDGDGDGDGDINIALCVIAEHRMAVDACEIVKGEECLERCTVEAVTPICVADLGARAHSRDLVACQADALDTCRMQCESGGAGFCEAPADLAVAPTGERQGNGFGHCHHDHEAHKKDPLPAGHDKHDDNCKVKGPKPSKPPKPTEPPTPPTPTVIFVDVDICIAIAGDVDIDVDL